MSHVDLRGFAYALEPERQRRQWRLDAVLAKLARVQQEIQACETLCAELQRDCAAQAEQVSRAWMLRPDPANRQHMLAFLARQQDREVQLGKELAHLGEQREQMRLECMRQQQALDLLDQHRQECRGEYEAGERSRLDAEADREWSARNLWAGKSEGAGA